MRSFFKQLAWHSRKVHYNIRPTKKKFIIFAIDGFMNLYLALYECSRVLPDVRNIRSLAKKKIPASCLLLDSVLFESASKMDTNKEKIQVAEHGNRVYGPDTVRAVIIVAIVVVFYEGDIIKLPFEMASRRRKRGLFDLNQIV